MPSFSPVYNSVHPYIGYVEKIVLLVEFAFFSHFLQLNDIFMHIYYKS